CPRAPAMPVLEITLQRRAEQTWPVHVWQRAWGAFLATCHEGTLGLNPAELDDEQPPKEYGTVLGKALFRDDVREVFVEALARSEEPLHALLQVGGLDLRALHWQRLCPPFKGRWDFLGLNQRTPFSLYPPSKSDHPFPPVGRRNLRALIVAA